jgi:hypothetical protein
VASQQKSTSNYADVNSATQPCITNPKDESVHGSASDSFILVTSPDKTKIVL